jgi:hypothetical protein
MATRMQQRRGTASQWTSANPILNAGEMGWESDTNKFKIGDGTNHWADLDYFIDVNSTVNPAFGSSITFEGATSNDFETTLAITDPTADRTITFPDATGTVALTSDISELSQDAIDSALTAGTGITKTYNDGANTLTLAVDTTTIQARVADVSDTEIGYLNGVTSAIQTQIDSKAPTNNASFTGTFSAPTGTITSTMIADSTIVNGDINASAAIAQSKIDGLSTSLSAKADLAGPTFTGTVALPSTTSIGDVSSTEIGYVNGVTSAIQTQMNAKAPLADPTFTGTVTLPADPASALQAATKQYVDNTASGIVAKPQVLGATTANIDATYNNGTAGVGATLTHNTNGAFPAAAGGASGWAVGKGILVKNQTNKAQNGRYFISNMGSASTPYVLTRCGYCDEADEIPGAYIFVQDGTSAGTGWIQVVADPATFVVGTDNIDVFQFSGSGTITAGTGITVNGNQVSIDAAVTQARVANVTDTEIGYLDGVTSLIQTQLDAKIAKADITAKGAILVGTGAGTYAAQSVGTNGQVLTANSAQSDGVEWTTIAGYSAPTLGSTSIASGATVTTIAGLTLTAPTLTGTVTASGDINLSAAGGPGSVIDELTLLLMGAI